MDEKYFSLSAIKEDFDWLESQGAEDITSREMIERLENGIIKESDVAPVVHGEWINVYGNFSTAECVVCKSQFEVTFGEESNGALWDGFCQFYRYCPYCGAKMDGEQNA